MHLLHFCLNYLLKCCVLVFQHIWCNFCTMSYCVIMQPSSFAINYHTCMLVLLSLKSNKTSKNIMVALLFFVMFLCFVRTFVVDADFDHFSFLCMFIVRVFGCLILRLHI